MSCKQPYAQLACPAFSRAARHMASSTSRPSCAARFSTDRQESQPLRAREAVNMPLAVASLARSTTG